MKLAQSPFSQSFALKTWLWCSATRGSSGFNTCIEPITGWIAEVCKLNVVAQKIPGRPKEILVIDERQKEVSYGLC